MKDRYFGDVHDYVKYALLRQLTAAERVPVTICWMLTDDDGGKDGRRTRYLHEPAKWRAAEPRVFDFLHGQVLEGNHRSVKTVERSDVLPHCRFYSRMLTDNPDQRQSYFDDFLEFARHSELVFFDPDNGVEVKSIKYGHASSAKYLYWQEIERTCRAGHSLMVYQHFPPQPRSPLVRRVARKLLRSSGAPVVYAIRTSTVAFFLAPRRGGETIYRENVRDLEDTWGGLLSVSEFRDGKQAPRDRNRKSIGV